MLWERGESEGDKNEAGRREGEKEEKDCMHVRVLWRKI